MIRMTSNTQASGVDHSLLVALPQLAQVFSPGENLGELDTSNVMTE